MPSLSIADIIDRFPDFRVALVVAEDLQIGEGRSAALAAEIAAAEEACRKRWNGTELSAIPGVAAWRAAYKGFGIKRTSYRSSVERLIKRVLAGGALPEVNALVDLYNAVSLTANCVSAATISTRRRAISPSASRAPTTRSSTWAPRRARTPTIRPRSARSSTPTRAMCCAGGGTGARTRAPPFHAETRRVALTAQSNGFGDVEAAAARLVALIERECAGRCRVVVADRARPIVAF